MGCVNGGPVSSAVLVQAVHDGFGGEDLGVGACDDLFGLRVNAVDQRLRVALRADLLHVDLRLQIVGPMCADRRRPDTSRAGQRDCA